MGTLKRRSRIIKRGSRRGKPHTDDVHNCCSWCHWLIPDHARMVANLVMHKQKTEEKLSKAIAVKP